MTTAVIFKLQDSAGFFSEFFFLVQSYIFAKKNGYLFFIQHNNWPYTYEKGWHDYFRSLDIYDPTIVYDSLIYHNHSWHGGDFNKEFRYSIQDYIDAIKEIYMIREELEAKALGFLKKMNKDYVAIFVRRGDKLASGESPNVQMVDILNYIGLSGEHDIFVQSDTITTIREVKEFLPNATLYHTVPENKHGWVFNEFRNMSRSNVKEDFEETLIGLYICLQANTCWTDNLSNVGRFLKLAGMERVHFYPLRNEDAGNDCFTKNEVDTSALINTPSYGWYLINRDRAIVFKLTSVAGFFSDFFFLAQAYIYAKRYGYKFFIEHSEWPYFYEKGWHDYFKTLEVFDSSISYESIHCCGHGASGIWSKLQEESVTIQEYADAIKNIFIVCDEIQERVNAFIQKMDSADYAAVFIRRGDKITTQESSFVPAADILLRTNVCTYDSIFVQSDSYTVVQEVKTYLPYNTIYHTVPEEKKGWFIDSYRGMTPAQKKADWEETLVGILICMRATECWTDISSNIGRFLKVANMDKVKLYPLRMEEFREERFKNKPIDPTLTIITPSCQWFC